MMPGRPTPASASMRVEKGQYYKILGVSKDACEEELTRAWHREAKKCHPDKGGSKDKFIELSEAYHVLSDPQKRRKYDQRQEAALPGRREIRPCGSYLAIDYRVKRRQRLKLGEDVKHHLVVSHEELQTGTTKQIRFSRNIICSECKGKGSKYGASVTVSCAGCQGTCQVFSRVQHLGRNWKISCKECRGTGETICIIDRCPQCRGDKVVSTSTVLEIHVEKGMRYGQEIIFPEEADEAPGIITGDVVFMLYPPDP